MTKPTLSIATSDAKSLINFFEKMAGRKATPEEIKQIEEQAEKKTTKDQSK